MQKLKQYWILTLLVVLLILAGFYWFQYRPYKARKDCAWKNIHQDAVTYKPASGSQQAKQVCIDTCEQKYPKIIPFGTKPNNNIITEWACEIDSKCDSLYTPEQQAKPETNWWGQTSKIEYDSCLRGKGF